MPKMKKMKVEFKNPTPRELAEELGSNIFTPQHIEIVEEIPLLSLDTKTGSAESRTDTQIIFVVRMVGQYCSCIEKRFLSYEFAKEFVRCYLQIRNISNWEYIR